jgi:prepilin-type N-terminal cleavage/methylation domain-containing protein
MSWLIRKNQKGFSLIELLLALAILGVVAYFIVTLTNSVRHGGKVGDTKQRMEIISAKMKEYYRHQGELPEPPTGTNEVPVDDLNLEAKFRFDGWGQLINYFKGVSIDDVTVDGVDDMAGYLISSGGDQTGIPTSLTNSISTSDDNIVIAINVNREAMEVALDEVRELQRRVNQFDNLFTGSAACDAANGTTSSDCEPGGGSPVWELNSHNCGTGSLDQIQDEGPATTADNYGCDNTWYTNIGRNTSFSSTNEAALQFIIGYYALGDNYLNDPWDNPYQWGCGDYCTNTYHTFDPRYRKFFSMGPDGVNYTKRTSDDSEDRGPGGGAGPAGANYDNYTQRSDFAIIDDIIP